MRVKDIMTGSPTFCVPDTVLQAAARMMCDSDCGEIPVLENSRTMRPVGVITDRDIACRAVAQGKNPREVKVYEFMSAPAIAVSAEISVDECVEILEKNHIRRVVVVDETGRCCGIVSQADIAIKCGAQRTGELVREVSAAA